MFTRENKNNKCGSLYILYGSQTGNSESIARILEEKFLDKNLTVTCCELNKSIDFLFEDSSYVFIICSTTGNGDAPINADRWWRYIKNRSLEKTKFCNIKYAVLGLGDTNYDKYCFMGKAIDKRMNDLSGERMLPLSCVDEACDMDSRIDEWIKNIGEITNDILDVVYVV